MEFLLSCPPEIPCLAIYLLPSLGAWCLLLLIATLGFSDLGLVNSTGIAIATGLLTGLPIVYFRWHRLYPGLAWNATIRDAIGMILTTYQPVNPDAFNRLLAAIKRDGFNRGAARLWCERERNSLADIRSDRITTLKHSRSCTSDAKPERHNAVPGNFLESLRHDIDAAISRLNNIEGKQSARDHVLEPLRHALDELDAAIAGGEGRAVPVIIEGQSS